MISLFTCNKTLYLSLSPVKDRGSFHRDSHQLRETRKTRKTRDLIPCLDDLQFRNGPSFVYANQSFGWQQFCVLYTEPENVSTIRFGWDTLNIGSYLFQNTADPKKQQSPPIGMRSAVPLGGLGKPALFGIINLNCARLTHSQNIFVT